MSNIDIFLIILIIMAIVGGIVVNNIDVSKWNKRHSHE
jgi:hypothetical protein